MSLVSVIIPAYNNEKYLEAAVRSVLEQTLTDIEVLIVNDASTDNTGAIADGLAQEDNRVRVFHHEQNKLRSGAINTGLDNATGSYISFLDSDDYYLLDKSERQVAFLEAHPEIDGVYGDFEMLLENKENTVPINARASTEVMREKLTAQPPTTAMDLVSDGYIPGCSFLIRAKVFKDLRFDTNLRNIEDLDMWLQILGKGFILARLPGSTYVYRRHDNQKSSNSDKMSIARVIIDEKIKNGTYLQS